MKKLTAIVDHLCGGIYDHIYANYKSYALLCSGDVKYEIMSPGE